LSNTISIASTVKVNRLMKKCCRILAVFCQYYLQFGNAFGRVSWLFGRIHRAQFTTMVWLAYRIGVVEQCCQMVCIQHNFLQKWCTFACLCAWASEGFFPGGH